MTKTHKALAAVAMFFLVAVFSAAWANAESVSTGEVNGSTVNVRSAPSTGAKRLKSLSKGAAVIILGEESGWYKISCNGETGYMLASLVKKTTGAYSDFGFGRVTEQVKMCTNPDVERASSVELAPGAFVKITGTLDGWYRVDTGADIGYLQGAAIEPVKTTREMISAFAGGSPGLLVAETAKQYLGIRYVYGGLSPAAGFDCSGLLTYVFKEALGYTFQSRTAMYLDGVKVEKGDLLPGDLVFFCTERRGKISHVGLYIGDGQFIHSPRPGRGVSIDDLDSNYYRTRYYTARRVAPCVSSALASD